jgi:hypothetical protein
MKVRARNARHQNQREDDSATHGWIVRADAQYAQRCFIAGSRKSDYDRLVRVALLTLIALAGCGRLGFGPIGGGDDVNPGDDDDATGDGGTNGQGDGGTTTPDAFAITGCGPTIIIDDDFANGTVGTEWTVVNATGYAVNETGGAMSVGFPATANANTHAGYRQSTSGSFSSVCAIAEITSVPSGSANSYAYLRLGTETLKVEMVIEGGMVIARFRNGGTSGNNGNVAYNPTSHRFLRIRETGGGSYNFEVAAALTGPYQSLGLAGGAIISTVSPSSLEVGGATEATAATSAGTATFERVLLLGP